MMTPHEKASIFADLLAALINDNHHCDVERSETTAGSARIVTAFDGHRMNIIITPARGGAIADRG